MKYEIVGEPLATLICYLKDGESIKVESGGMSWMSPNLEMVTEGPGGVGKAFGRMLTSETIFQNKYRAVGEGIIAISSSFPGSIKALDIRPGKGMIVQKSAFLAATEGIDLSMKTVKGMKKGFFGGEGLFMQRISGQGTAFIEIDGHAVEYDLAPGQEMVVSTGFLALMEETCTMEVHGVQGLKNKLLGGEGWFNTVVTGPGKIILQTMPVSSLAKALGPFLVEPK